MIRNARCGRLDTEYRNKLGWLKGNLYSRIDTTDWAEWDAGETEEKAIIKDLLDAPIGDRPPLWVPSTWIAEAKKKVKLEEVPQDRIEQVLRDHSPKPPLDSALAEVRRVIDLVRAEFSDRAAESFRTSIENDPCIMPLVATAIAELARGLLGRQEWQFFESLVSDDVLRGSISAKLIRHAANFANRHGPRSIDLFVDSLSTFAILEDEDAVRIGTLGTNAFGDDWMSRQVELTASIRALTMPRALLEHLRIAATSAGQETLSDRAAAKLTNSQPFKKTLRPE